MVTVSFHYQYQLFKILILEFSSKKDIVITIILWNKKKLNTLYFLGSMVMKLTPRMSIFNNCFASLLQ